MSDTTASTYVGRHRPSGMEAIGKAGASLSLEAAAKRGHYDYTPRHSEQAEAALVGEVAE